MPGKLSCGCNVDNRALPGLKIDYANLEWTATGAPRSGEYKDIYRTAADPLGESRHAFLQANRIAERLAGHDGDFVVAEAGFGGALNFLLTVNAWLAAGCPRRLHYLGFERHPLRLDDLRRSVGRFPELAEPAAWLLAQYPPPAAGCHRLNLHENLQLDLFLGDAAEQMLLHGEGLRGKVHAWYLDGFSPAVNPKMWSWELFNLIADCSAPGATVSTYSAVGAVRRGLRDAGFSMKRIRGFAGKRHMLRGVLRKSARAKANHIQASKEAPAWFRYPSPAAGNKTAAVIGAGIAGSATAWQLARRGWRVCVFERAGGLDHGVNSLGQLALQCRAFGEAGPLARFFLLGFLYSTREFGRLARDRGFGWHPSGLAQLPRPRDWKRKLAPTALAERYPDEVLQWLSREQLRELTGLPIAGPGWHSPAAGWLDPLEFCQSQLDHSGIELRAGTAIEALAQVGNRWNLLARGEVLNPAPFGAVVVACGADAAGFGQLRELPLRRVPGEVVSIPENRASGAIRHIIRGGRGIFPASHGRHCVSASFAKDENDIDGTAGESLAMIEELFEPKLEFAGEQFSTASAWRCQSADFAPVVGAAPDVAECRRRYAALARNAKARILQPPAHLPGLYVNLAHGSHGLCGAPLAAEYLASVIHGEIPPLDRDVAAALDPLRFLIRRLRRQETD